MKDRITKKEILKRAVFWLVFSREFKAYLGTFVREVNKGKLIGENKISEFFIKAYQRKKEEKASKERMVFYLFILVFELEKCPFASEEERANKYYKLYLNFKYFYPNYYLTSDETGCGDIFKLGLVKYIIRLSMNIEIDEDFKSILCYSLYVYVNNFYTIISVQSAKEKLNLVGFISAINNKINKT
ncbi:MAG: hypothetical protein ACOYMA_13350 [Bacteroidia bacterium]